MPLSCFGSIVWVVILAVSLSGCNSTPLHSKGLAPSDGSFLLIGEPDFGWTLSGDRRVAPLQIFSDQWRIWMQWYVGQPIPSVLVMDAGQWHVAELRTHGKFSIIEGQWRQVRFQGGRLRADARHDTMPTLAAVATEQGTVRTKAEQIPKTEEVTLVTDIELPQKQSHVSEPLKPKFEVMLSDQTIRQALTRWALEHHWNFSNSHWAVPVDIPITAQAVFREEFIESVRLLLAATEIAGRPLQPCFYTNRVLRVISANESCDPTLHAGGGV